jgi:alkanesulfonate monooxygenase SsuD/methylene tetrahydromethanopterin reductase-like flavin-dependent oxidoreductase (luciferase family)
VRGLTETYRRNLPHDKVGDVILGIHLHVARSREEAIENGALALATQAEVFLTSSQSRPNLSGVKEAYATKSASRMAFEKLATPAKARLAVAEEKTNIMAVWGTPQDCIEKIKFYVDAIRPEQLMVNIASGTLPQEKALASMRLFTEEVMSAAKAL